MRRIGATGGYGHRGARRLHHLLHPHRRHQQLLAAGAARTALAYLAATLFTALAAVYTGTTLTRWAVHRIHHQETR